MGCRVSQCASGSTLVRPVSATWELVSGSHTRLLATRSILQPASSRSTDCTGRQSACPELTLDASGGYERFLMRFLDLVEVKGKRDPVPVYELVGRLDDEALAERYLPILGPYRPAVPLYQAPCFAAPGRCFLFALDPHREARVQPRL